MEARSPAPQHRRRRLVLRVLFVLVVTALGLELGTRWLLFGDAELAQRLGARLRDASKFAQRWEDEFWQLQHALDGVPLQSGQADPIVGWRSHGIRPGDLAHRQRGYMKGRRPVLMYGDSYTACVTPQMDCWQGLLERSERGADLCLMNYGVGGYGLDQMLVMLRHTIDHWSGQDPIVILGILVDDDLDRCMLSVRTGPKPWFSLASDGALIEHAPELQDPPPQEPPTPAVLSYLWRYLRFGADWLPWRLRTRLRNDARHTRETKELCGRILVELQAELEARAIEYFVVTFHLERHLDDTPINDWREPWLTGELARLGIPYVSSRLALAADLRATGDDSQVYFVPEGEYGQSHLNARGNAVVFRAMLRGLAGDYDG